jgi:hypothetical protein
MKTSLEFFRDHDHFAWLGAPAAFLATLSPDALAHYAGAFAGTATGIYYIAKTIADWRDRRRAEKSRPPFKPFPPRDP